MASKCLACGKVVKDWKVKIVQKYMVHQSAYVARKKALEAEGKDMGLKEFGQWEGANQMLTDLMDDFGLRDVKKRTLSKKALTVSSDTKQGETNDTKRP